MTNVSQLTAAILMGGLGTRLRSVVSDRSKVMAEVHGRPFVTYLFDHLLAAGLREVVLCTGYMGEQVRAELGGSYQQLRLIYSQEPTPLGTGGAVRLALPHFRSETVLVLNGDSFCAADLSAFYEQHRHQQATGTLLLTEVEDSSRYGRVATDDTGAVLSFVEKGAAGGPGWINAGVYLLQRDLIATIPAEQAVSIEREVFPAQIGAGLYGYHGGGEFIDIGTPQSYRQAELFFAP